MSTNPTPTAEELAAARRRLFTSIARAMDAAITLADLERQAAEARLGLPNGDMTVLDDPGYNAALDVWVAVKTAHEAVRKT